MKSELLKNLFDEEERRPLTVSELNQQVKSELERRFSSVWVEGEIVNFMAANSGHWYFTLNDGESQLRAACYVRNNMRIRFKPFDGLQVQVRGKLTLYAPRGEYQILVESLQPVGEGALKVAFEQIKAKLEKEGLFDIDEKRPLPFFPRRVGVVTSPNGAAFLDILNVLSRRTRSVNITLIPTRVQGESAGDEIADAIEFANRFNYLAKEREKFDVLIVGRGGGSAEDLWAFNEEQVARAIFNSEIPVISAVGHEIDFTIADFVADRRAPTPSAAAEIVAESEDQIAGLLGQAEQDLFQIISHKLLKERAGLRELVLSPVFGEFPQQIRDLKYEIENFRADLNDAIRERLRKNLQLLQSLTNRISPLTLAGKLNHQKTRLAVLLEQQFSVVTTIIDSKDEELKIQMASLNALSPLAVLNRGYSITKSQNNKILRDAANAKKGETLSIKLAKGMLEAEVLSLKK